MRFASRIPKREVTVIRDMEAIVHISYKSIFMQVYQNIDEASRGV